MLPFIKKTTLLCCMQAGKFIIKRQVYVLNFLHKSRTKRYSREYLNLNQMFAVLFVVLYYVLYSAATILKADIKICTRFN